MHKLVISLIALIYGTNFVVGQKYFPKAKLMQDIDFYFTTIEENHPDPYANKNKFIFDSIRSEIQQSITDSMNIREFLPLFAKNVNNYFDVHTGFEPGQFYLGKSNARLFPDRVKMENEELFILDKKKQIKVKSINDIPAEQIYRQLMRYTSYDMALPVKEELISGLFSSLFFIEYGSVDSFNIQLYSKNKSILKQAVNQKDSCSLLAPEIMDYKNFGKYVLLTINTFSSDYIKEFDSLLDYNFNQIIADNPECLFIDVTLNGGGNYPPLNMTLDYLYPDNYKIHGLYTEDKNGYNNLITWSRIDTVPQYLGDVILLQSVQTASGGSYFASALKTSGRALIVGNNTCEFTHTYSSSDEFILPNTKVPFSVASQFHARPGSGYTVLEGVRPHVYYEFGFDSITSRKDLARIWRLTRRYYKGYFHYKKEKR